MGSTRMFPLYNDMKRDRGRSKKKRETRKEAAIDGGQENQFLI